jgi:anti-sigma B factor antagonist
VCSTGPTVLGLLTTLTRRVRNEGGEAVLANVAPPMEKFLESMQMDGYWDVFDDAREAIAFLERRGVRSSRKD